MNKVSNFDELDEAIATVIANPDPSLLHEESEVAELLQLASDLRHLPRPDFKLRLKTELGWVASSRPLSSEHQPQPVEMPDVLPTLFGRGYGTYPVRRVNFLASAALHAVALALIVALGVMAFGAKTKGDPVIVSRVITLSEYIPPVGTSQPHGGGGGGDADKLNASHGALAKAAFEQLTPPLVVVRNLNPKLSAEPTIVAPNLQLPQTNQVGDPLSSLMTPSNGIGVRAGIGTGGGGGIGPGAGPGFGPGAGGNYGDGVFNVGNGVSAPRIIYDPDPEYSEEARAAKHQGTVILQGIIGPDGRPRGLRVERSLGMGLDEKALEAVAKWRFDPAKKDGHPVPVMMEIEVSFHLY